MSNQWVVDVKLHWTHVKIALPPPLEAGQYERYLVATKQGGVLQCSWLFGEWHIRHDGCSNITENVTHWMPLPTHPQDRTRDLRDRVKAQAEELSTLREVLYHKNRQLDALHYVWCSGGCETGMHRWTEDEITDDLIARADRNVQRMRMWLANKRAKEQLRENQLHSTD